MRPPLTPAKIIGGGRKGRLGVGLGVKRDFQGGPFQVFKLGKTIKGREKSDEGVWWVRRGGGRNNLRYKPFYWEKKKGRIYLESYKVKRDHLMKI